MSKTHEYRVAVPVTGWIDLVVKAESDEEAIELLLLHNWTWMAQYNIEPDLDGFDAKYALRNLRKDEPVQSGGEA